MAQRTTAMFPLSSTTCLIVAGVYAADTGVVIPPTGQADNTDNAFQEAPSPSKTQWGHGILSHRTSLRHGIAGHASLTWQASTLTCSTSSQRSNGQCGCQWLSRRLEEPIAQVTDVMMVTRQAKPSYVSLIKVLLLLRRCSSVYPEP
jgi:hypothetical protein